MAVSYTIGVGTTISAGYTISLSDFTLVIDGAAGSTAAKYGVFSNSAGDTITNFGNVLGLASGGDGVRLNDGGLVQNQSGAISGAYGGIIVTGTTGIIINQGSIGGAVRGVELTNGGSVSNGTTATMTGNYDVVIKGALGLVNTAGKIQGGKVGVALEAGGNVFVAPTGTISGALAVQLTGGAANVNNRGFIGATGGASGTAISMAAGFAHTVNVYSGSTIVGTVSGGNTVGGTASSTLNLYSGSGTGTITGLGAKYTDFQDYFVVSGDWVLTGTNTIAAGAQLYIDSTLTNSGAVQGIVQLESFSGAAPSLTNALGAIITGNAFGVRGTYGPVGVVNDGLITATSGSGAGVQLTAGGSVSNQSAGTIGGGYGGVIITGAAGTLTNQGSIGGTTRGVELTQGGSVSNAGTGTISGFFDVVVKGARGTVNTAGKILGGGVGVALEAGGNVSVAPTGTITGALAVQLTGGLGNVYNRGFIGAAAGTSGTAISMAAGFDHLIYAFPGSTIVGTVSGGNTVGGTAFSEVVFYGSTGVTGTITGLASKYTGFQYYFVGPGDWVLTGTNAIPAGAQINITGTLTNSGAVQGIVQLEQSGPLTPPSLTNASGAVITGAAFGVRGTYGPVGLVNDGLITATSGGHSVGVALTEGGSVTNQSAGTIRGAFGVYIYSAAGTVTNYGQILGGATATAVVLQAGGTIDNQGTVIDMGASSYGMKLHAGGVVMNGASAYISGSLMGIDAQYGGTATITNQGTISGGTVAGVILEVGGTFTNAGSAARVIGGGVGVLASNGAAIVSNQGTIKAGTSDGVELTRGGTVLNAGTIISILSDAVSFSSGYTDLLVVDPGAAFSGNVDGGNTIGATAVSTLELATGVSVGTLSGLGTQFIDFAQTTIDAGAAWSLALPSPAGMHGSIAGFGPGDTIDLAGVTPVSVTFASGTLEFAGGSFPLALAGASSVQAMDDGAGGALVVACFRAGTRIATTAGEVLVERLAVGDRVRVVIGQHATPVTWIGHRHIDCRRHPDARRVWPVRIARGAFGAGRPHRDLWLSPDHAVFLNEVLIPVKMLINGSTIVQVPTDKVTYYHIELPHHDVLLAEGLPVESYLETGDRTNFANGSDSVRLFPDFASRTWEARGCAPLVVTGPRLEAALTACRRAVPSSRRAAAAARSA